MRKKELLLIFKINENDVDLFLNKVAEYSALSFSNIIVFYDYLSYNSINRINDIYKCDIVKENKFKKAKFEMFTYLKEYETVAFVNIKDKLTNEVLNTSKSSSFCIVDASNNVYVESNFKTLIKKYRMFEFSVGNSTLIINDNLKNYKKITKWCLNHSILYYPFLRNRIESIIDLMIQRFDIDVVNIRPNNVDSDIKNYSLLPQKISNKKVNGDLVSIVMSIYNRIDTIEDSIRSIVNQTYKNIELIIVVEYSDNQQRINDVINSINDSRIKVINNKKKLGFPQSLNLAIQEAKGKYIARMDDDDISNYSRIEKQVSYLKNNPDIAVLGTDMQFFENSDLICKLPKDFKVLKIKCLYKTPLFHPTVMFNMTVLNKSDLKYRNIPYAEDYDLWSRLVDKYKLANLDEVLYYYRLSGNNASTKSEKNMNEYHLNIMRYQLKEYLDLVLTFDELQLLSGRIDVLGNSVNTKKIWLKKRKIFYRIISANQKVNFFDNNKLKNEMVELDNYYELLCQIKKGKC